MVADENMSTYLAKLEYAFEMNETQDARKCSILWSHLTASACDKLMATGPVPVESYNSLKYKLLREFRVGYATAAKEALKQPNPEMTIRDTLKHKDEMLAIVTETATNIPEALSSVSRMLVRSHLTESLVYELDSQVPANHHTFQRKCEERKDRQSQGASLVRNTKKETERGSPHKLPDRIKCFTCGKPGHTSKVCRANRQQSPQSELIEKKPIVCFNCREVGHKSPSCPKPKAEKPRKKEVKLLKKHKPSIKEMQDNEIFVNVAGKNIPVTLDSGATITVLPKEAVPIEWLTGKQIVWKGFSINHHLNIEKANLSLTVAGKKMETLRGVVPSKDINAIGVLSYLSAKNIRDLSFPKLLEDALNRPEEDRLYVDQNDTTPEEKGEMEDSLKEGGSEVEKEEVEDSLALGIAEEGFLVQEEGSLVEESEREDNIDTSVVPKEGMDNSVEKVNNTSDDCCISDENTHVIDITTPRFSEETIKLREDTVSDESLKTKRNLADKEQQGYSWKAGLVLRERLDDLCRVKKQICIPASHRKIIMTLAHENFGHLSRNSVVKHITKSFYWPTLWKDVRLHVMSCAMCQRATKKNPKRAPMIAREIVTIPFERVSIDLVGPLPKNRGRFQYLFTYIDNASRWPEAEPLRSITAKSVIKVFETIYLRNGLPGIVVSDNGTQFCSKQFEKFCQQHDIKSIKSSPYRPQSNGFVERMHATLTGMIQKLSKTKQGFWHELTRLALYFMRMTPSSATGFSPYMVAHGWEPASPLEAVKEGLLEETLEDIDITSWVKENMERIDSITDKVVDRQTDITQHRKKERDKYSKRRNFIQGTQVLYRTPGLNTKMTDAWEGPYVIDNKLGPVTYSLTIEGDKKKKVAHINTLKEYNEREIRKITTVLEEDREDDDITNTNDKVKLIAGSSEAERLADIQKLMVQFQDTLKEEPGMTDLTEFSINTGKASPIAQRPYMTANCLKKGVQEELNWLLERGFIEETCGEWASPIVTVRKPNGKIRICVDFRKVNAVTTPLPIYMPRIEEVLEATGQPKAISKMDLSKGYYQVRVCPEDRDKTTFVCHKGKFRFTRMPFGVCNAPAVFQALMEKVLKGLGSFCKV